MGQAGLGSGRTLRKVRNKLGSKLPIVLINRFQIYLFRQKTLIIKI